MRACGAPKHTQGTGGEHKQEGSACLRREDTQSLEVVTVTPLTLHCTLQLNMIQLVSYLITISIISPPILFTARGKNENLNVMLTKMGNRGSAPSASPPGPQRKDQGMGGWAKTKVRVTKHYAAKNTQSQRACVHAVPRNTHKGRGENTSSKDQHACVARTLKVLKSSQSPP